MPGSTNPLLEKVYAAGTVEASRCGYDAWASNYDRDLFSFGYRLPAVAAAVFARHIGPASAPVLDAGCGTGLQTEALRLAGYGPFVGIDLSPRMLAVARAKGLYQSLHEMVLGEKLGFDDGAFPVTLCIGALTPGHAPVHALDELIRVTAAGGWLVFSLRVDAGDEQQAYLDALAMRTQAGRWREIFTTAPFASMPDGEAHIRHCLCVYEVC